MCAAACVPLRDLGEHSRGGGDTVTPDPNGDRDGGATAGEADAADAASRQDTEGRGPVMWVPSDASGGDAQDGGGNGGSDGSAASLVDAATSTLLDAGPACAAQELVGPDGNCYFLEATPLTWDAARSACQARGVGWDLASLRSAAESEFLGAVLSFEAWIGASDATTEGTWVWVNDNFAFWSGGAEDGSALGGAYVNWNATEPNGGAATNCARVLPDLASPAPTARWADLTCTEEIGAVCEQYPM